jgi:hypothetical protein
MVQFYSLDQREALYRELRFFFCPLISEKIKSAREAKILSLVPETKFSNRIRPIADIRFLEFLL